VSAFSRAHTTPDNRQLSCGVYSATGPSVAHTHPDAQSFHERCSYVIVPRCPQNEISLLGRRNQGCGERGALRLNGTPVIPRCNDAFVFGQIDIGKIVGIGHG
jgi:hypothetical protein